MFELRWRPLKSFKLSHGPLGIQPDWQPIGIQPEETVCHSQVIRHLHKTSATLELSPETAQRPRCLWRK